MLLFACLSNNKLNYVMIFLVIGCIGNIKAFSDEISKLRQVDNKTTVTTMPPKTVKKELRVKPAEEIAQPEEKDNHTKVANISEEKPLVPTVDKGLAQEVVQQNIEKAGKAETVTKSHHHQEFLDEDFILNNDDDLSESLTTGFYFFLLLSSGAIIFIAFKIYRLRLSRAERKYGVQGDRSAQELTPLPISLEDGHSDEEDQTLFEIQRQHIRIL